MTEFQQEYMCQFYSSPAELALDRLADQYHQRTEAYDRTVCTGANNRGTASMPMNQNERMLITYNARRVYTELVGQASELGFGSWSFQMAIVSSARRFRA